MTSGQPRAPLEVDLTFALDEALGEGRGLPGAVLEAGTKRMAEAAERARERADAGTLGFHALPERRDLLDSVLALRDALPEASDIVLAGIGGSALGARVFDALREPRDATPRLHVLDTVDPDAVEAVQRRVDPGTAILLGISKSGATLEAAAVFLVLEAWFSAALGAQAASRIVVVCGEEPNPFRAHAEARGYACLDVPANVGGRYSALSPVGLLPAALGGVDPERLIAGAAAARRGALEPDWRRNPALALAAIHHAASEGGRRVALLWPYGEALRPLGPWWAQLVGESLGKAAAVGGPVGVTPLAATGPADQHSLLQLVLEGPDDKLTVFVRAAGGPDGATVPTTDPPLAGAGRTLGAILAAEAEATAFALAEAGRPAVSVVLPDGGPESIGAFLFTYEMAVAYWGDLWGVDPFDQPAVGRGKRAAAAALGFAGVDPSLRERLASFRAHPRTIVS